MCIWERETWEILKRRYFYTIKHVLWKGKYLRFVSLKKEEVQLLWFCYECSLVCPSTFLLIFAFKFCFVTVLICSTCSAPVICNHALCIIHSHPQLSPSPPIQYLHFHPSIPSLPSLQPKTYTHREGGRMVKVLCILHHWGVQLTLAYSWARPAILIAGKGRGGMFLFCFFTFIPVPLSSLSLSFISTTISSIFFSPFLWEMTQNDPQGLTCR